MGLRRILNGWISFIFLSAECVGESFSPDCMINHLKSASSEEATLKLFFSRNCNFSPFSATSSCSSSRVSISSAENGFFMVNDALEKVSEKVDEHFLRFKTIFVDAESVFIDLRQSFTDSICCFTTLKTRPAWSDGKIKITSNQNYLEPFCVT